MVLVVLVVGSQRDWILPAARTSTAHHDRRVVMTGFAAIGWPANACHGESDVVTIFLQRPNDLVEFLLCHGHFREHHPVDPLVCLLGFSINRGDLIDLDWGGIEAEEIIVPHQSMHS